MINTEQVSNFEVPEMTLIVVNKYRSGMHWLPWKHKIITKIIVFHDIFTFLMLCKTWKISELSVMVHTGSKHYWPSNDILI